MTATRTYATSFDEAWTQFTARPTTEDEHAHPIHTQMHAAKSAYISFLIPVTSTQIVEATRPAREALTAAGIADVLPSHYFHISVLGISLASQLKPGSIARIMDRTSRALRDVMPVRLHLRGVNSFPNAAFVEVHDNGGLAPIREILRDTLQKLDLPGFAVAEGGASQAVPEPFLPHMSLCYYKEPYPAAKVAEVLTPYREMEMGSVRINYLQLAAMPYSDYDRFPEITRIADLLLG